MHLDMGTKGACYLEAGAPAIALTDLHAGLLLQLVLLVWYCAGEAERAVRGSGEVFEKLGVGSRGA